MKALRNYLTHKRNAVIPTEAGMVGPWGSMAPHPLETSICRFPSPLPGPLPHWSAGTSAPDTTTSGLFQQQAA